MESAGRKVAPETQGKLIAEQNIKAMKTTDTTDEEEWDFIEKQVDEEEWELVQADMKVFKVPASLQSAKPEKALFKPAITDIIPKSINTDEAITMPRKSIGERLEALKEKAPEEG